RIMKNNSSTSNASSLQGRTAGITTIALLFLTMLITGILFSGCKKKAPAIDPAQLQKEFVQNIASYSAPDFTKALASEYTTPGEYTIIKLPKGATASYKKDTTTYKGTLEADLYCLKKSDGLYLNNGIKLLSPDGGQEYPFTVFLFPQDMEWNRIQLFQYNEKYPLTILTKDFHAVIKDYEDLQDIWDPDNESRYILGEPIPMYTIETADDVYLFGKELQPWHTHDQVTAAMSE
ncbi:MAG: hypothetical protein JXK93_07405, partial [Sphaerochaetaceae bacterium]|nr:hypothetical protein [Sphaerochaetaceae bacterium]